MRNSKVIMAVVGLVGLIMCGIAQANLPITGTTLDARPLSNADLGWYFRDDLGGLGMGELVNLSDPDVLDWMVMENTGEGKIEPFMNGGLGNQRADAQELTFIELIADEVTGSHAPSSSGGGDPEQVAFTFTEGEDPAGPPFPSVPANDLIWAGTAFANSSSGNVFFRIRAEAETQNARTFTNWFNWETAFGSPTHTITAQLFNTNDVPYDGTVYTWDGTNLDDNPAGIDGQNQPHVTTIDYIGQAPGDYLFVEHQAGNMGWRGTRLTTAPPPLGPPAPEGTVEPRHYGDNDPLDEGFAFEGSAINDSVADTTGGYWNVVFGGASRYTARVDMGSEFTATWYGHVNSLPEGSLALIVEPETDNSPSVLFNNDLNGVTDRAGGVPGAAQFVVDTTRDHIYQIIRARGNDFELYVDGEKAMDLTPGAGVGLDAFTGWAIASVSSGVPQGGSDSSWRLWELREGRHVYKPGDNDEDGDVDFADFSVISGNFTGTITPSELVGTGGKTFAQGDYDWDGDVDFGDFSQLAGNFTGTITAAAASSQLAEGNVELEIDLEAGAMTLIPNNASLAGYSIRSTSMSIMPDPDTLASPFLFYLLNQPHEVTAGTVGAATVLTEPLSLDIAWLGGRDAVFEFTRFGEIAPVMGKITYLPEPVTLLFMAAGGLMILRRRG